MFVVVDMKEKCTGLNDELWNEVRLEEDRQSEKERL